MKDSMLSWAVDGTPPEDIRHLFYSLVIPRPIAWVSTMSAEGHANLAPHSFYNAVSSAPPILMIASTRHHAGGPRSCKDTLANILATGEFVVCFASAAAAPQMNETSRKVAPEIDEFELAGLEKAPSANVRPWRIATAPAAMECRLHSTADIGDATVIYGNVVHIHVAAEVMTDGRPDPAKLSPVARLGGSGYSELGKIFSMKRP